MGPRNRGAVESFPMGGPALVVFLAIVAALVVTGAVVLAKYGVAGLAVLGVGFAVLAGLVVAGRFLLQRLYRANAHLVGRLRQLLIHR